MSEKERFISGIYNYCDRWCERCPLTGRCQLYYEDNLRKEEHELAGEDPNDPEVLMSDLDGNLQEAVGMIQALAVENGIDFVEMEQDEAPIFKLDLKQFPIHQKAHLYARNCHRFLDKLCEYLQQERSQLLQSSILPDMEDAFQVLTWYHMQIPMKVDRALSGRRREKVFGSDDNSDSDGSAKVAHLGLMRSMDVLTKAYQWTTPFQSDMMDLLNSVYELMESIDQEFPGYKTFKRPGFDD